MAKGPRKVVTKAVKKASTKSRAGVVTKGSRRCSSASSHSGVALRSAGGRVQAIVEPRAGCAVVSMLVDGREWLRLPEPLESFLRHDRTGGVPLLFPWSNRLRSDRYDALGHAVDLQRTERVHRDGDGRPMHGVLLRWDRWRIEHGAGAASAANIFRSELSWGEHRDLVRAFPFEFILRITYRLFESPGCGAAGIEVETEVQACDGPVPLSFGWHPYLMLPAPRAHCRLDAPGNGLLRVALLDGLPLRRAGSLELDDSGLHSTELTAGCDDLFAGVTDGMTISVESDQQRSRHRVAVDFVRGYRLAQLYSPRDADFMCIEPMMAPTAALSDAAPELPILGAGQRSSAIFRISVSSS